MPLSVRLSPRATADLKGIAGWIVEQSDAQTALVYVTRVREACLAIADRPNGGTPRGAIGPGLRSVTFERRLRIFYRVGRTEIVIVRIIHGSRDLKRVFRSERGR